MNEDRLARIESKLDNLVTAFEQVNSRLDQHSDKLDQQSAKLDEHSVKLDQLSAKLDEHSAKLDEHSVKLDEHSAKLDEHSVKLDEHSAKLDEHSATLVEHSKRLVGLDHAQYDMMSFLQEKWSELPAAINAIVETAFERQRSDLPLFRESLSHQSARLDRVEGRVDKAEADIGVLTPSLRGLIGRVDVLEQAGPP